MVNLACRPTSPSASVTKNDKPSTVSSTAKKIPAHARAGLVPSASNGLLKFRADCFETLWRWLAGQDAQGYPRFVWTTGIARPPRWKTKWQGLRSRVGATAKQAPERIRGEFGPSPRSRSSSCLPLRLIRKESGAHQDDWSFRPWKRRAPNAEAGHASDGPRSTWYLSPSERASLPLLHAALQAIIEKQKTVKRPSIERLPPSGTATSMVKRCPHVTSTVQDTRNPNYVLIWPVENEVTPVRQHSYTVA